MKITAQNCRQKNSARTVAQPLESSNGGYTWHYLTLTFCIHECDYPPHLGCQK